MKPLIATALVALLTLAPAVTPANAQGVGANVNVNPAVIDPGRLQNLRCRLGLVNPRACITRTVAPQQRTQASTRPQTNPNAPQRQQRRP